MTLSARLWADNSDLAAEALAHPFVCRLSDGSLAREIFASYVAQDAFFLESFARAYALALARSSDTPTLLALADLLAGVREELGLHASYAARWGIVIRTVGILIRRGCGGAQCVGQTSAIAVTRVAGSWQHVEHGAAALIGLQMSR